ncbi:MAG: hypothetical protein ABI824_13295 [Acidobacteriota bacterium]
MRILVLNGGSSSFKCALHEFSQDVPAAAVSPLFKENLEWDGADLTATLDLVLKRVGLVDEDMFRMALDIAQIAADQVAYIEDRPKFVQVAEGLGIRGIHHVDYETTVAKLDAFGLRLAA